MRPKKSRRIVAGTALGLAATVFLTGAAAASAEDSVDAPAVLGALQAAAPATVASAADVQVVAQGEEAVEATVDGTVVEVAADSAEGVTLSSASVSVEVALPFSEQADEAVQLAPGIAAYDNNNGSTTVPVVVEEGAVAIHTVIDDADAPVQYPYQVGVPEGGHLELVEETGGAVVLDADGAFVAGFASAWGRDASGEPVPTRYEVQGNTLVQHVDHRSSAA